MHTALLVPGRLVLDGLGTESHVDEPQLTHGKRLPRSPQNPCKARNAPTPLYVRPMSVSPTVNPHTIG
ncbi:hypothetical protein SAV14893_056230 [Streptomyces avermitilis]|nr:hypothetical protein SAVMC3_68450 [Streptomyces avermitilis]GDY66230.1 hypothetical protein SAV14893_056230 [Streptomyces avermitilis]GDY82640.1 hypothetical protein SAVCW2_18390 [Streptomyces avermitilis]